MTKSRIAYSLQAVTRTGEIKTPSSGVARRRPASYHHLMQRLFSMFPTGRPGLALLLMRFSLALMLMQSVVGRMLLLWPSWTLALPIALALAVTVGIATPIAAALAVVVHIITCVLVERPYEWLQVCTVLDAIALVLLGPGAYSLDSKLFGRRRIAINVSGELGEL